LADGLTTPTSRYLLFTAPRRIEVRQEPIGTPGAAQVLVETHVSAISAGTELLAYRGLLPPDAPVDEALGALRDATFAFPFRFGYAAVGDVVARGPDVDPSWIGRRVFAFQPHATAFCAPVADLRPVPADLPSERAVLVAQMETAVSLILDGAPMLGERVLVIGQGTVGLLVTALLARFPLALLGAVETRPLRAAAARALGAGVVTAGGGDELDRLYGARGADLIYELSGNPAALDLAIAAAGHEARVVVGSWYGGQRASVDLGGRFHRRRLRLISSQVSHIGAPLSARWDRQRRFDQAWQALAAIDTLPLVTHRFPIDQAGEAYELLDRQPEKVLQVLLDHRET
jgi:2-desacetyl-2-hydroxyethyl bacteriochlorophyllide A dehydrogenase